MERALDEQVKTVRRVSHLILESITDQLQRQMEGDVDTVPISRVAQQPAVAKNECLDKMQCHAKLECDTGFFAELPVNSKFTADGKIGGERARQ